MNHVTRINLKTDCKDRSTLIDFCLNGDKQYLAIGWSSIYRKDIEIKTYNSIANKSTTIKIECELIGRDKNNKKKAVVQVKGGKTKSIDALSYKTKGLSNGYFKSWRKEVFTGV